MLETFGDSYRAYMARTGRVFPWISEEVPMDLWDREIDLEPKASILVPFPQHMAKKRLSGLPLLGLFIAVVASVQLFLCVSGELQPTRIMVRARC